MDSVSSDLPGFYYDLQSLAPLKQAATEDPKDLENLHAVAEQFESMFLQMVLKSMRAATPSDNLFDSKQSLFYRDMFDQQLSVKMSQEGGLGLADLLVEQLSRNSLSERPDPFANGSRQGFKGLPISLDLPAVSLTPTPQTAPLRSVEKPLAAPQHIAQRAALASAVPVQQIVPPQICTSKIV